MSSSAQSWVDTTEYPFEHKYLKLNAGQMHYIDQGEGQTILFVHGTPTWSFLYRDFIKELSSQYRCVAIDHLGFGLSDKPNNFIGTPQAHAHNLSEFIRKMDLKDLTLVVHDFGGPIGLAAAIENSYRIKNIVLLNTWLWGTKDNKDAIKIDNLINSRLGKFLYLRMNISPKLLLKKGFYNKRKLTRKKHQQYIYPFPTRQSRLSLLNLAKSLVGSSDWYDEKWLELDSLENKKWCIVWGTKDSFITPDYLKRWKGRFPEAQVHELECGHFIQEEKTREVINTIGMFIKKSN